MNARIRFRVAVDLKYASNILFGSGFLASVSNSLEFTISPLYTGRVTPFYGFGVVGARLCILACHTSKLYDRFTADKGYYKTHLEYYSDVIVNRWAVTVGEIFGTVAALKEKGFPFRSFGQLVLKFSGFIGKKTSAGSFSNLSRFC